MISDADNPSPAHLRHFGSRVRQERERLGISQEELAHRSGLHRTYVGSVERGERNVSLANIHALAVGLGVAAADLLVDGDSA